jgi:hypothetical protein
MGRSNSSRKPSLLSISRPLYVARRSRAQRSWRASSSAAVASPTRSTSCVLATRSQSRSVRIAGFDGLDGVDMDGRERDRARGTA